MTLDPSALGETVERLKAMKDERYTRTPSGGWPGNSYVFGDKTCQQLADAIAAIERLQAVEQALEISRVTDEALHASAISEGDKRHFVGRLQAVNNTLEFLRRPLTETPKEGK